MPRFSLRFVFLIALVALLVAPAGAMAMQQETPAASPSGVAQEAQGGGDDPLVDPVVIWSLVGLVGFAAVMGVLYYFKREVGGFPENPTWVAPITIMPSKDFPDEEDYGEEGLGGEEHAEHPGH